MYIFLSLFITIFLFSADINKTIVDANISYYQTLLKSQDFNNSINKALIKQIINIKKQKINPFTLPKEIKTQEDFSNTLKKSLNILKKKRKIEQSIESLNKKIEALKDEISNLKPNDKKLLTLQLQYTFYKSGLDIYKKKLKIYNNTLKDISKLALKSLNSIYINNSLIKKELKEIESKQKEISTQIEKLNIDKERFNLLNRQNEAEITLEQIKKLKDKNQNLTDKQLIDNLLLFASALKEKNTKIVFNLQNRIESILDKNYPNLKDEIINYLNIAEKRVLGNVEVLKGATLQEAKNVTNLFWKEINRPLFNINGMPISTFKLALSILIFVLSFLIGQIYKKYIRSKYNRLSASSKTLISNLGYYFIILVAFFISLNVLGINLSSFALVAGALSVGIGFGLQNIVSNFVSGLILMFERSIKIGDYIEFDSELRGRVSDIRLRSITITTNDNIDVVVPNKDLIENRVINWTMNDRIKRFKIPFGVAYGSDVHKVIGIILKAVKNSGFRDIYEDKYRKTRVVMKEMGDSSVNFELYVWIKGEEILYPNRTTSRFLILIYDALYENGIEIPFPQQDLHIKSIDATIPIEIRKDRDDK